MMSTELPPETIRNLTSVVTEVRVAADTLPPDERKQLVERRESNRQSRWQAQNGTARPLQRRA